MKKRISMLLLGRDEMRMRQSYIWNSLSGLVNALQSTIILFFLMRISDTEAAGVFTLSFATANMMLCVGKYGVRYFQISDTENKYSYSSFFTHRMITCITMVCVSLGFCLYYLLAESYTPERVWVCLTMCILKTLDAVEDVIHGEYQRQGYLDTAGRCMMLRQLVMIFSFLIVFRLTGSLSVASVSAFLVSAILLAALTKLLEPVFGNAKFRLKDQNVFVIMKVCFPLFLSSFLSMYLVNAPKYAIDAFRTVEDQAIYGFISMPVFIVGLIAEFVFRPMTTDLAEQWHNGNLGKFWKKSLGIIVFICVITGVCIVGGMIVGIPVLSTLYNYNLDPYRLELAILLTGGGMLALVSFQTILLTIIRSQSVLLFSYGIIAIFAMPLSNRLVVGYGLMGAASSYLIIMGSLCVLVAVMLVYKLTAGHRKSA